MLLLLLGVNVSLNPGPLTLGVLNARSIRNNRPLLAHIVTNDLDFLCLIETHVCPSDSDSFLQSLTHSDIILPQRPRPSGIRGSVSFLLDPLRIESPFYQSFGNIMVSIEFHGCSLLLAYVFPSRIIYLHLSRRIHVLCQFSVIH